MYIVTVTSQGQITIPAKIRRQLGFGKSKKALVSEQRGKIVIEPSRDILDLQGAFKTDKKISPKTARQKFEEYLASRTK